MRTSGRESFSSNKIRNLLHAKLLREKGKGLREMKRKDGGLGTIDRMCGEEREGLLFVPLTVSNKEIVSSIRLKCG